MGLWDISLATIDAVMDVTIDYTGQGIPAGTRFGATKTNEAAPDFDGKRGGAPLRKTAFEIRYADLPRRPATTDRILCNGRTWRPELVTARDDLGRWTVDVIDCGAA